MTDISTEPDTRSRRARALVLEMFFIFVGVTAAFFVENYRDRREARGRAVLLAGAIDQDIGDSRRVRTELVRAIDEGLATFEARLAVGQRPVPYVLEISGSLRPPSGVWEAAAEIGLRDFADPDLLFALSYYYGETQGVADNFVRYSEFAEREFWPVALSDTSRFYCEDGRLRGEFAAHIQQLRDHRSDITHLMAQGDNLRERLRVEFPGVKAPRGESASIYESVVRRR